MRRIFFTLSLFICIYSHSQNKQALLKSDSLFAKGVELYNQKDYKAAIPLFTESDKIDKAELDSTSNRRSIRQCGWGVVTISWEKYKQPKNITNITLLFL